MKIDGYDVTLSKTGRVVTMTKNNITYNFLVDSEYKIIDLSNIDISNSGSNSQETAKDYTENLLYKVNFKNLLDSSNEKVTIHGTGITVDDTNTYATFDGTNGITIDGSEVDPEGKLIGTSTKTIALWYKSNVNSNAVLFEIGNVWGNGTGVEFCFWNNLFMYATGNNACDIHLNTESYTDGKWHFVVGVFENGNSVRGYYDGVKFKNSGAYNTLNSQVSIGGHYGQPCYYTGNLADLRIYSSALNDEQVQQLYEYGKNNLINK